MTASGALASTRGHHRPYEGQQQADGKDGAFTLHPGHHRPYEGQQPWHRPLRDVSPRAVSSSPLRGAATGGSCPWRPSRPRSSSPLRGAATGSRTVRSRSSPPGHHRPYEGQQREVGGVGIEAGTVSSSPLRGAATSWKGAGWCRRACRSSSPLRGAATSRTGVAAPVRGTVIIAPTRGSNTVE